MHSSAARKPAPQGDALQRQLLEKIHNRSAVVGVVGLGYVGLPFAADMARAGFRVIGVEKSAERRDSVNRGESYIPLVSDEELKGILKKGLIKAEGEFAALREADILIIAVPTPITRSLIPDLGDIQDSTREISRHLRAGQLVCLESTTFPGTTSEVVQPILEATGMKAEQDFFLAYSPERMDPGNPDYQAKKVPRVVSGTGPLALELIRTFYEQSLEKVVPVSSTSAAEIVKIFENTFRAVNLALVNEFTRLCDRMQLDVWEVLDAAFTKPYGIMPFYPGPGVGGHCTPVDPHYLEWKAKELNFYTQFIDIAGRINRSMPHFVRKKAVKLLLKDNVLPSKANVLVLGVTYKKDVPDCRNSPASQVIHELAEERIHVTYYDPYIPKFEDEGLTLKGEPFLTPELLKAQDLVVIVTDHSAVDYDTVVQHSKRVLDTRNATKAVSKGRERIVKL